jgi:hypothetical protein
MISNPDFYHVPDIRTRCSRERRDATHHSARSGLSMNIHRHASHLHRRLKRFRSKLMPPCQPVHGSQ